MRLEVVWKRRSPNALGGRFGGGWQWAAGFRAGGRTVLLELFVGYLRVSWRRGPS